MRILLLGGTTQASELATVLAAMPDIEPVLSLAGRTADPRPAPIPQRIGGFGGVEGLADHLRRERIDLVVDATHPFADRISANARAACRREGVPLLVFTRPPWRAGEGDRWIPVTDAQAAAMALGDAPRRVLLTVGRQQLGAFAVAPHHSYLARVIDPPDPAPLLPELRLIRARGPFTPAAEEELMRRETIEVVVTKNSGGEATAAKLVAARRLGLPVVMIERKTAPDTEVFHGREAILARIARHRPAP